MIVLIAGASHTGKTALAQRILERYHWPYLSIDHLKMGLIRSGNTCLTACSSDEKLTDFLWPIVREMVKTAIENKQNLIVEGCYIPVDWARDFTGEYRREIRCVRLVMSEQYIRTRFDIIKAFANVAEQRVDDSYCTMELLLAANGRELALCQKHHAAHVLIDEAYDPEAMMREIERQLLPA